MYAALVLTVSDRSWRGEREDLGGPAVASFLQGNGFSVVRSEVVPDDRPAIVRALRQGIADDIPLIVTTGGTGFSLRDVTPEATLDVLERRADGLAEHMRRQSQEKTRFALLSRSVCGTAGRTLVVNLPGSPTGACESLESILAVIPHALKLLRSDDVADAEHRLGDQEV